MTCQQLDWETDHEGGWNCYNCGAFTRNAASIPEIQRDCLRCWSLIMAMKETDSEFTIMPFTESKTLLDIAKEKKR